MEDLEDVSTWAIDWNTLRPVAPPTSVSQARSGWGIMPRTLRPRLTMPAMFAVEPLGFAAAVIR
ncbi:MAG TPA: hypothetical protein VGF40_13650, partial [Thermoanaerobaculia bacterium]